MPVIGISVARLHRLLRAGADAATVERLLGEVGCDVEGVVSVRRYQSRHSDYMIEVTPAESLPLTDPLSGFTGAAPEEVWQFAGEETVVRLDLLPVRPDLFDAGGLARALRGYMGVETGLKDYTAAPATWRVEVDPRITDPAFRRPFIQCAIVRGLSMDDELLRAIMRLQENLHWALCRDRKFASIGAYDLATLASPIRYTLVDPDGFCFTPLFWGQRAPVSPRVMLAGHPKGVGYAHLVEGLPLLPALLSANGNVLSLPPIINAEETKLTLGTRDVLIDVTGSNLPVVTKALSILATSLVELDPAGQAALERVAMAYPGRIEETPALALEQFTVQPARAARLTGVPLSRADCVELLRKMRHGVEDAADGTEAPHAPLSVTVAAYRNDIMHEVDLIEDIAIAYGYHRIPRTLVTTFTAGEMLPINQRSRLAAAALCGLGFIETTNLILTSERDHYEKLRRPVAPSRVVVANPASTDQTMLREHLYASLLETLSRNTDHALPQRIFEVGDAATFSWPIAPVADPIPPESGAHPRELRVIAGALCATRTGYAQGRSVLDALLDELKLGGKYASADMANPTALPGRAAVVLAQSSAALEPPLANPLAEVFEVHPEVLEMWRLGNPVVLFSLVLGYAVE
jgi:phenylalanyl-tRNA synthetase beta chain